MPERAIVDVEELALQLAVPLAGVLPDILVEPALGFAFAAVARRHPGLFDRLDSLKGRIVIVAPTDVDRPLALGIDASGRPWFRLATPADRGAAAASVSGPIRLLLALLEGRVDGDAVFFTRALEVEGDMSVVVALRNAVDGEDIDFKADLLDALGPMGVALTRLERLAIDVGRLLAPVERGRGPERV